MLFVDCEDCVEIELVCDVSVTWIVWEFVVVCSCVVDINVFEDCVCWNWLDVSIFDVVDGTAIVWWEHLRHKIGQYDSIDSTAQSAGSK